jgi:putative ABC transport system ATP-binding protein
MPSATARVPSTEALGSAPSAAALLSAQPILAAHGVRKSFREGREEFEVLRGVDFALQPGEIVALEGPSGSGKTTLLSILGGILTPSAGRVVIDGEEIAAPGDGRGADTRPSDARLGAIRRRSIGFVFQQYNLFPALTAVENVAYAARIKGLGRAAARLEAARLIAEVGLDGRADFLPRDLSGGQKQRVAIARALVGSPPILLADEPTANLDTAVGRQVLELFHRLAKSEERALLVVTHDPQVRPFVDRVVGIRDGRIDSRTESGTESGTASGAESGTEAATDSNTRSTS